MANINGTINNDPTLFGTAGIDTIDFSQGGVDIVKGFAGDDLIKGGAAFSATDQIDGGLNYDKLDLDGDYSGGITFGATTLTNVEEIHVGSGNNYALASHDSTVAAGQVLKLDAYHMSAGKYFIFDGSAETNGSFLFYDGVSNDTVIGGAQSDTMSFGYGGNDTAHGGGGGDVIGFGGELNTSDDVDGGDGDDVLYLSGDYSTLLTLDDSFIRSIESIGLGYDFVYNLATDDSFVAAGENVYVSGWSIEGAGYMLFNGTAETDGTFSFVDSANDDYIAGSQGDDRFDTDTGGDDLFFGAGGDDMFFLDNAVLGTGDWVDGGAGDDWLAISGDYSAGVTFTNFTFQNIEDLTFDGGFDYDITLADGNVAAGETLYVSGAYLTASDSLVVDASAETDGRFEFYGAVSNDVFKGGSGDDYADLGKGGVDTIYGGGGDDTIQFWDTFTTADFVDGGDGDDHVNISNNYPGGLTLGAASIQHVESISFWGDFNYHVTTLNSLVAAGATLEIDSYYMPANKSLVFDGSAETDGSFIMTGGAGHDTLLGGAQADTFYFSRGGNDVVDGNGGNDVFWAYKDGFTGDDHIDGGAGYDTVIFYGDYSQLTTLYAQTLQNVEQLDLFWGYDHSLKMNNGNVGAGKTLKVDAHFLGAGDTVNFNGSAETNGQFHIISGAGADTLVGGAGNDTIDGGAGADAMTGGAGNDTYVVDNAGDTTVEAAGGGADTVKTSVTHALAGNAENLILTGSSAINGHGNSGANTLSGNSAANLLSGWGEADTIYGYGGNDTLNGGAGVDAMTGGLGDDTYIVDNAGDTTVEAGGGGTDEVQSSVTFTLSGQVEDLVLTGAATINGTGNALANTLYGNSAVNSLAGAGETDTDTLTGFGGGDVFVFADGGGADTVTDFQNGSDKCDLTGVAGVDQFADLILTDTGAGVNVDYGTGSFELANIANINQIDASDFLFA